MAFQPFTAPAVTPSRILLEKIKNRIKIGIVDKAEDAVAISMELMMLLVYFEISCGIVFTESVCKKISGRKN